MKKLNWLTLALSLCLLQNVYAQMGMIDVRDYGAMGDDTDQTAALQAAINAANAQTVYFPPQGHGGATETASGPTVYLPAGRYRLNTYLNLGSKHIQIMGDRAVIRQTSSAVNPSDPAIKYGLPYRNKISGLIFIDFANAIELGSATYDVDQGVTEISNCQFIGITDTAIKYGHRSSIFKILDCRFDKCQYALKIWNCDMALFERCWISKKPLTLNQDSVFKIEGGTFDVQNSIFITQGTDTGQECAWISMNAVQANSHYQVRINTSRFSDENNGTTLVNWYVPGKKTYPVIPRGIIIRDTNTEGGPPLVAGQDQSVVRLFDCPNFITIKNNYGFLGALPMVWANGVDGTTKVWADYGNAPLTVDVAGNCGNGTLTTNYRVNDLLPEFVGFANLRN